MALTMTTINDFDHTDTLINYDFTVRTIIIS